MASIILKILLFAVSVTFLLAWGYVKQQRKNQELLEGLMKKSEEKVLRAMKKDETVSKKDIEEIITGTKASLFWSKNKVQITDPKIVSKNLISDMLSKDLIVEISDKKSKKYKIK